MPASIALCMHCDMILTAPILVILDGVAPASGQHHRGGRPISVASGWHNDDAHA